MKRWWQRNARRIWLAMGIALGVDLLLTLAIAGGLYLRIFQFSGGSNVIWCVAIGGVLVTGLSLGLGYVIYGWAVEPIRETLVLARYFAGQSSGRRFPVSNPHDEIGELEQFLNELIQRLEGSYVEVDRFASDVSHELRTPLTAMRSVGEVALRERNPAILYDAVGSMLEEVRRMNQLIDRLLLLTRGDSDKWPVRPKAGLVRDVLMEVSETLGTVAEEKGQHLQMVCPDPLKATFDQALLRLALMNLTQNAIRYSPAGRPVYLRAFAAGQTVVVEVADEGPGIAPEHQHKIFQRFYRVDEARSRAEGGVGLGLAIVKWAVERTGGKVELESEVGRGSVFRLRLPHVDS